MANTKSIIISCSSSLSLINFRGKLIEELKKDHDVAVFCPKIESEIVRDKLNKLNVSIYENNLIGGNVSILTDIVYIFNLFKLIKKLKPDTFFSYTFKPVIYGSIVASICKVDKIVSMITGLGNNLSDDSKSKTQFVTKKLLRLSLNMSKNIKVVFQNRDDHKKLVANKILNKERKVYVVNGSGVDLTHYECSEPDLSTISFLMLARMIKAKGIEEYYEAAKLVLNQYPNTKFKLIAPVENNINAISKDLFDKIKKNDVIEHIGRVDDVRPFIKEASVVVLPSFYGEGVPRSILEGMSMGRAIITTDAAGCRETVSEDKLNPNGFLVPIKNIEELAQKMKFFIENPDQIIAYGKNGRTYAENKFDVHKVNRDLIEIFNF